MANIGDLRRYLFVPFECKWNVLVREVTADIEQPGESVDEYEVFKRLVGFVRDNGQLDRHFLARSRLGELFADESERLEDAYIAWMRWAGDTTHRHLVLCDSDAQGAFKVYRHQEVSA